MAHCNAAGLHIIREDEGCVLFAYDDAVYPSVPFTDSTLATLQGTLTIAWGHTGDDVYPGQTCSQAQADEWLLRDVQIAADAVQSLVEIPLNPNPFSALCSFVYNIGESEFATSTMLRLINQNNLAAAADEFARWIYGSDGVTVDEGLVTRRAAEKALFLQK